MLRLKEKYINEVAPAMQEKFGYKNVMEIPKLVKIVVNMGLGETKENQKAVESAVADLKAITGQAPIVTKAKRNIAAFKLRVGMQIGCKVTLREDKMYAFADKLFNIALPRIRDFHGITGKNFDGKGNFAFGVKEQIIFPEINYEKVEDVRGLDIVICTTAKTDEEAKFLLTSFNMPYKK